MEKKIEYKLNRIIKESVTSSTARKQPTNTIQVTHSFLKTISLSDIDKSLNQDDFQKFLDDKTQELSELLPSKSWGHARKFLNIFLLKVEDSLLLAQNLKNHKNMKSLLEIPIDKKVAKSLIVLNNSLPTFYSIHKVTPEINKQYQDSASKEGKKMNSERVELDDIFWAYQ